MRAGVAANLSVSSELLDFLSRDKDDVVKFFVAGNSNTLSETLAYLAMDKHPAIKCQVAINKNTLPETLILLGKDYDITVKFFVANNPNTPEKIRKKIKKRLPAKSYPKIPSVEMLYKHYDYVDDEWN